jgi:hypothetical protein
MEMILLDWTRMGKAYCVAGLVPDGSGWRSVRPMPARPYGEKVAARDGENITTSFVQPPSSTVLEPLPRNVGWFANQLQNLQRWDWVQLLGPQPAEIERPHTEDILVRALRPIGRTVPTEQRAEILQGTVVQGYKPHFGVPLLHTRTSAYLKPGVGERSLVTVTAPAYELFFEASKREGAGDLDVRVRFKVPGVGVKELPVKDHFLLAEAEQGSGVEPVSLARNLRQAVTKLGNTIAVRLGLSRGYGTGGGERRCWLMADGFFPVNECA